MSGTIGADGVPKGQSRTISATINRVVLGCDPKCKSKHPWVHSPKVNIHRVNYWINKGEKTALLFRIYSDVCKYSTLRDGGTAPHSVGMVCSESLLSKTYSMGSRGRVTFQWEMLTSTAWARWSRSTSTVLSQSDGVLAMTWWEWQGPSVVPLSKSL